MGFGIQYALANKTQASGALGDQHAAIGKKCGAPGIFQRLGHHHHANILSSPVSNTTG